jgi:hypothetical protein
MTYPPNIIRVTKSGNPKERDYTEKLGIDGKTIFQ